MFITLYTVSSLMLILLISVTPLKILTLSPVYLSSFPVKIGRLQEFRIIISVLKLKVPYNVFTSSVGQQTETRLCRFDLHLATPSAPGKARYNFHTYTRRCPIVYQFARSIWKPNSFYKFFAITHDSY